jgi:hypothetical protein
MYTNSLYITDKAVKHQLFICEQKTKSGLSVTRITLNITAE